MFPGQPVNVLPCNYVLYVALNKLYAVVLEARDSVNIWQCYGLANEFSRECSATFPGYIDRCYTAHTEPTYPHWRGVAPRC